MDAHGGGAGAAQRLLNDILDVGEVELADPHAIGTIVGDDPLGDDLVVHAVLQELEGKARIACTVESFCQAQVDHRPTIDVHIA